MIHNLFKLKDTTIFFLDNTLSFQNIKNNNISSDYINWMNDPEVVRFTEQKFMKTSKSDITRYLHEMENSPTDLLFGIYNDIKHIGTIKLGAINFFHKTASLSYLIGAKEYWGKGIASCAISEMINIGFSGLQLEKINAGVYANNIASVRVLEKNGFELEGIRKSQFKFENERINGLLFGRFR